MLDLEDHRFAKNFVDGAWSFSREGYEIDVQDPREGVKIAEISRSSRRDVDHATAIARSAAEDWQRTPHHHRLDILESVLAELRALESDFVRLLEVDVGVPRDAGRDAVGQLLDELKTMLERGPGSSPAFSDVFRGRPVVSAHLHDWNTPPVAFARLFEDLGAGRAVILHPSELTPLSGSLLARTFSRFPPGVATLLQGTHADVAARLSATAGTDRIVFYGPRDRAAHTMRGASDHLKHVRLCVNGPRAYVATDGAHPTTVAAAISEELVSRTASPYATALMIYASSSVYPPLRDALIGEAVRLGRAHSTDPGAIQCLPSESLEGRVREHAEHLMAVGARVHNGGQWKDRARGYWFAPAIIENYDADLRAWPPELIAPIVVLRSFETSETLPPLAPTGVDGAALTLWTAKGSIDVSRE